MDYLKDLEEWSRDYDRLLQEKLVGQHPDFQSVYFMPPENPPPLLCDCGAQKTSNPNCHVNWCSTNGNS